MEFRVAGTVREVGQKLWQAVNADAELAAVWAHAEVYPVKLVQVLENLDLWRNYMPELPADAGRLLLHVVRHSPYQSLTLVVEAAEGGAVVWNAGRYRVESDRAGDVRRSTWIDPAAEAFLERIAAGLGWSKAPAVDKGKLLPVGKGKRKAEDLDSLPEDLVGVNLLMVRLWRDGYSQPEISGYPGVFYSKRTVRKKISELRKLYGDKVVPWGRRVT